MSPVDLLTRLEAEGVRPALKLKLEGSAQPSSETLALIRSHRDVLVHHLSAPDTLPRLPWQLERLLSAAGSDTLTVSLPGVPDAPRYTLAWGAAYLTGDRDEALRRLWGVYRAWQGVN